MSTAGLARMLDRWSGRPDAELDSSLLSRFVTKHDEDAFAALVVRHGALVYGTCRRILGDRHEADDAFQAVFFVLARRAATLRRDRSIGPWLHGVALRVAKKLRGQLVRRRLREMAVAKSERVEAAEPDHDFWAVIDEEVARLSLPLREALLLCDLSGQSHAQAAKSLGLAKGTVTKRLAKAHEQLAARLKRRGLALGVGAVATMVASQAPASTLAPLVRETVSQAIAFSTGSLGGSAAVRTLAEGVMRLFKARALKLWLFVGLLAMTLAGGGLMLAGNPGDKKDEPSKPTTDAKPDAPMVGTAWRETYTGEFQTSLPVSVAFSADGNTLLTGDTNGEVMALNLAEELPTYRWKSKAEGSHAALAYSADPGRRHIYVTTKDGVRILDANKGGDLDRITEPDSNPIAIGVFPDKHNARLPQRQIVFGNARGYFVKSWADRIGTPANTTGGVEVSTVAKDAQPADVPAVPLAVDPKGSSAIMTGLRDGTGQFTGVKGKNVLWAYVCGDYSKDSPGNRIMVGHSATVVCAAWAKEGSTAVTGDADGRVIVWDAKMMKEARRVELGGRVLAVAISDDGANTAAFVRGKQGAEVYVWETAKAASALKPIHTQPGEFGGEPYASLTFSADGKRVAGCAIDKKWLPHKPNSFLPGQAHIWKLDAEPKAQAAPKHQYTIPLSKGYTPNFVVLDNFTIITSGSKEGAIDLRNIRNGEIQARMVLGNFAIGRIKLSSDRKWLAIEQHAVGNNVPSLQFDVGVYEWPRMLKATVPSCTQTLDVASGGKVIAVVRENLVEIWDVATVKKLKSAPFKHTRIDAAQFSPDGKLLAVSDQNNLVLWRWEEHKHERVDLGRCVGSLAFSPDGRFLAEGPTPRENLQIREVETRKIVQSLTNGTKQSMNIPRMAYVQGGRVLIACDNILLSKEIAVPHRINLWDTTTGAVAHQLALPAGLPLNLDVSPNGRYLAAMIEDGEAGLKLSVWRLDGEIGAQAPGLATPAASPAR
jgi:RNA polymerase sigma factor (sigma-70 family)